jgi:site-specific DNA-methyltransferase (adenine-specific)
MSVQLVQGDCIRLARSLPADSIDSLVCDPPYEIGFMGKSWDSTGIAFQVEAWKEFYRTMKPGAYLTAFGGTRSHHRLMCAIEDAGFEIRDCLMWVYGQGFPKSRDISKAIDKEAGQAREVIGIREYAGGHIQHSDTTTSPIGNAFLPERTHDHRLETTPTTQAARQWDGWGTALKPAWEPIVLARKPLSEKTVAANMLRWGTGAINIDGCRIGMDEAEHKVIDGRSGAGFGTGNTVGGHQGRAEGKFKSHAEGRWPANLVHDGSAEVLEGFPSPHGAGAATNKKFVRGENTNVYGKASEGLSGARIGDEGSASRFFYCAKADKERGTRPGGFANIGADKGSSVPNGPTYDDGDGSTSRFFYCAKASKKDRNAGCDAEHPNKHPTVKPTALMQWLTRLTTQPGGTVFDPFMGSGSTGRGAVLEGFNFIGCDLDPIDIARMRIADATPDIERRAAA